MLWRAGRGFVVRDLPWTVEKLRVIPPFEFENWAVIALGGIPNKVQVGDMGVASSLWLETSGHRPDTYSPRPAQAAARRTRPERTLVSHPSETKGQSRPPGH